MDMEVPLGSRVNVRELMNLLEVIEWAQFSLLYHSWRERSSREVHYHPGPVDEGAEFLFNNPWMRRKI